MSFMGRLGDRASAPRGRAMSGAPIGPGAGSGGSGIACAGIVSRLAQLEATDEILFATAELEHLSSCASCRAAVATADPAALFSVLALETKEGAFWTGFETRILAAVREEEKASRAGVLAGFLRPRFAVLAAGAAAIAAAALFVAPGGPFGPAPPVRRVVSVDEGPIQRTTGAEEPARSSPEPMRIADAIAPRPMPVSGAPNLLPLGRDAASPAPVETVSSPTAQVLTINHEDAGRQQADVVLIVDQGIDI